jgi:hypothetical protein
VSSLEPVISGVYLVGFVLHWSAFLLPFLIVKSLLFRSPCVAFWLLSLSFFLAPSVASRLERLNFLCSSGSGLGLVSTVLNILLSGLLILDLHFSVNGPSERDVSFLCYVSLEKRPSSSDAPSFERLSL